MKRAQPLLARPLFARPLLARSLLARSLLARPLFALPLLALLALASAPARAEEPTFDETRRARVEAARAEIARQVQLQAFDLLDELVYGWIQKPVFGSETQVVLADVTVPVGFGSGLEALVETHVAGLLVENPGTQVRLVHCPQCTALIVHSGAKGTIVSRGVDQPEALVKAGLASGSKHALFLDFEAEGSALVLRARIVVLEPALPIVYARTLSTQTATPALLRESADLKSAEEARAEYTEMLEGSGLFTVPVRLGVRQFATGQDQPFAAPPFIWLQAGAELALSQARAWTGSLSLGATWLPTSHTGFMAQARIARLLTGSATSLTHPDLYGYVGGSITAIYGVGASVFAQETPTIPDLLAQLDGLSEKTAIFPSAQLGLELRVRNRISAGVFIETSPTLDGAPAIGNYFDIGVLRFHSVGAEVSFCF